ncbi:hypothetical protein Q3C01_01070 [Bradyrhizobium sp. UFLA05-109]
MNAPTETLVGKALEDAIWLLETRALIRAYLEYEHQYEHLADAVDPLQEFAERSGLVAAIGQDRVQELIGAPFARFRAIVAAEMEEECAVDDAPADLPPDYAAQLVRQWELADPRDRWRHTGELPPALSTEVKKPVAHKPMHSTVNAFLHVSRNGSTENLRDWLASHPLDAPYLLELWTRTCTAPQKQMS